MQSSLATVISVMRDSVLVSIDAAPACARCAAGKGCGAGILAGPDEPRQIEVALNPALSLRVGDQVRLSLHSSHLLRASVLAYGLPLAGIVLSLAAGAWIVDGLSDTQAVMIALPGYLAGYLTGRYLLRRENCIERLVPTIAERIVSGPTRLDQYACGEDASE